MASFVRRCSLHNTSHMIQSWFNLYSPEFLQKKKKPNLKCSFRIPLLHFIIYEHKYLETILARNFIHFGGMIEIASALCAWTNTTNIVHMPPNQMHARANHICMRSTENRRVHTLLTIWNATTDRLWMHFFRFSADWNNDWATIWRFKKCY